MKGLVFVLCLAACGAEPLYNYNYRREPDPRKSEYVIGVSDRLTIRIWKNPDLSTDAVVRPDGTITMPLLGDLKADGRTPSELKGDIATQLAKFVRDEGAVVTVAVVGISSYSFTVGGNVERPGVFNSQKYVTVHEAMQLAGGPNRFASPQKTKLTRRDRNGDVRVIPINYKAILNGKQPEANLTLIAGDQLYVP